MLEPTARRTSISISGRRVVDANRLRRQTLDARKRQKLLRQLGPALDRRQHLIKPLDDVIVADAPADQIEVAANDHQEIVEVVSQAARQLSDDFHFLRLMQKRLGALAARRSGRQAVHRRRPDP